jgi:hypothetical protein
MSNALPRKRSSAGSGSGGRRLFAQLVDLAALAPDSHACTTGKVTVTSGGVAVPKILVLCAGTGILPED